jgi:hypothetical protein
MVEATVTTVRIRPRLLAVWLVLLALIGAIAAVEYADRAESRSASLAQNDAGSLLPVPVDQLGAIELGHAGTLHRFERDSAGAWFYHGAHTGSETAHQHQVDPLMAQRIANAFAALGRARIERRFPLAPQSGQYGVTAPGTIILLYRVNDPRPLAQYAIGDIAPDTFSRYLLRMGSAEVVTIPNYQVENLLALVK